jgi:hypothetical protein
VVFCDRDSVVSVNGLSLVKSHDVIYAIANNAVATSEAIVRTWFQNVPLKTLPINFHLRDYVMQRSLTGAYSLSITVDHSFREF